MGIVENIDAALKQQQQAKDNLIKTYKTKIDAQKKPADISGYQKVITNLETLAGYTGRVYLKFDYSIIEKEKEAYKKSKFASWKEEADNLDAELQRRIEEIETDVGNRVDANNAKVKDEFEKGNKVYLDLEEKRKKLETYSDFIVTQCARHGVTSNDILIDNHSYKLNEWNSIYDTAFNYIKRHAAVINPITWIRSKFGNEEKAEAALFIILLAIACTTMLNYISIFFLIAVFYSELCQKKQLEQCAVLLGLLYNVRPLEMGYTSEIDKSKLLDKDSETDNDERTAALMEWYDTESARLEESNPEGDIAKEFAHLNGEITKLITKYEEYAKKFNAEVDKLGKLAAQRAKELREMFEEEKKYIKKLGDDQNESLVYRPNYMLGWKDGYMPEYVNTGLQNIIIKPCKDVVLQTKFIQALVVNALCNVKPLSITITVVDPNDRGKDVIGFRNEETEGNFKIEQRKMTDIISSFDEIARKNMEMLRGIDIQTYNNEAEETGKTPIDYNIILVLSGAEKKEDNEELAAFMSYSANMGIFVWVVTPLNYNNCFIFEQPFAGVTTPLDFDILRFPITFGDMFGERLKKSKPKGLGWGDYLSRAFKPDEFWSGSGNGYIWIEPGFVEGDPSRPDHYTLGNTGDVHGVIAGTSGAGKSVYINHIIATMTKRYGPRELELWLVDFKGSEFSFYLKTDKTPKTLPHIKACLCTSDPEYSKSLFRALRTMADTRYNTLKQMQLKNMVQYNELMEKQGTPEKRWPRCIMIVDEFQVIFTKADGKTIDSVNQDIILISKVARACGVHLIFASQSMKGTISADTLAMFTLRMCLRCEIEVSQQILGTPYAGMIRQKNGFLYVGSADDKKKELQKRFKTPWAPDEMLREHINKCYDEAIKSGWEYGNVIEYNENTKHAIVEVDGLYDALAPQVDEGNAPAYGTIFLGRLMVYSSNKAPENIILTAANNENMYCCFMDMADFVNFFFTLKKNFDRWKVKPQVVYNSQSEDFHYLCHLDEIVPQKLQVLSSNKTSIKDMVDTFLKMVDARKAKGTKDVPLIFMCLGWASAVGFGVDPDQRTLEKFTVALQTAGEYNIHWIFLDNAKGSVSNSVFKACKHRIVGKVDEATANTLVDTAVPSKPTELTNGYAWLYSKNELSKFKIFQSELDREVKQTKIVM